MKYNKPKFFRIATVPVSLCFLLDGQLKYLNKYYEITAIASDGNNDLWNILKEKEGVKCHPIPMARDISIAKDLLSLINLYIFFSKERPDIIHANTPKASLLSMLAAKVAGVPIRIYTVTGLRFEGESGYMRKILILMEKLTCWAATKVIPEGEGVKHTLYRNKITSKPLKVVGYGNINGINSSFFQKVNVSENIVKNLKYDLEIKLDELVFCFVGRIVKDKGINELVNAFIRLNQKYPHTKLLLVGPFERDLDPLKKETEEMLKNHASIIVTGFQQDVRPFFAISDIFVFPSYREGFPNVVMQAGAMDLPCIVSDINGCNEIIKLDINGIIIPPKNTEALYDAMELLLTDNTKRTFLASNARKMIADRYEQSYVWSELLKEYQSLEQKN